MGKFVADKLREAADLHEQRDAVYGSSYKEIGKWAAPLLAKIMPQMKPTEADFNRLMIFMTVLSKIDRYAANWGKGGHEDSTLDISVYMQMLNDLDNSSSVSADGGFVVPEKYREAFKAYMDKASGPDITVVMSVAGHPEFEVELDDKFQKTIFCHECGEDTECFKLGKCRIHGNDLATVDQQPARCVCGHLKGIHRYAEGGFYHECNDKECSCKMYVAEGAK